MAKNNVLFNGLSAVTSGSNGMLLTFPDVCKTQVGPAVVPIPYPNIAQSADLDKGSKKVMIEGKPASLESSTFSKSTGDEAGSLKGIISSAGQGEAKPLLFSPTVKVEGKAGVRNTDIHVSNKMNTPPAPVMQAQVPPGIPPTIEDAAPKCPKCDKDLNKNCMLANTPVISTGTNIRRQSVYDAEILKNYKDANKVYPQDHPWYTGEKSLQIHHVIDIKAVEDLGKEFYHFNYNINHAHNLIVLPSEMANACKFGVPLHRGKHSLGRAIGDDKSDSNVTALESTEKSGDYKAVVKEEKSFDTYPEATKEEMEDIEMLLEEGAFCYDDEGNSASEEETQKKFLKQMNLTSDKILKRISDFVWTINRDGRDYKPGNPCGCSGVNTMTEKKKIKIRGTACKVESHGRSEQKTKKVTLKMGY